MSAVLFPLEGTQSLLEVSPEWLGKVVEGPDASSVRESFPGSVVTEHHSLAVWYQHIPGGVLLVKVQLRP